MQLPDDVAVTTTEASARALGSSTSRRAADPLRLLDRSSRRLPGHQDHATTTGRQQGGHRRRDAPGDADDRNLLLAQIDPQILDIMLEIPHGRVDGQAVAGRHGDRVPLGQE